MARSDREVILRDSTIVMVSGVTLGGRVVSWGRLTASRRSRDGL